MMEYQVIENRNISLNYHKLSLDIPSNAKLPLPGQFYNVRCGETKDPLLRRPFSMHRLIKREKAVHLEILYRVLGKGTEWLSRCKAGQKLDAIGPLGNGFVFQEDVKNVILIARGIGIAPLYGVAEAVLMQNQGARICILMGGRTKERIFYEKECRKIGQSFFYTDDGSKGFQGSGPQLLRHLMECNKLPQSFSMYACGPSPMLRDLSNISEKFELPGQVALEEHMGCGLGACLSCACPLKASYIRRNEHWEKPSLHWSEDGSQVYSLICKDGPVYNIQEVDWDELLA
ncbi:MAG: dihydroorotate dehydrogenase electron transfer subunit [Desulfobacteraceae bacterium]|nr:MAG: dihydroorotate dehydrogenase electron transfer subunit [Desulfobacteraceae bacterium]